MLRVVFQDKGEEEEEEEEPSSLAAPKWKATEITKLIQWVPNVEEAPSPSKGPPAAAAEAAAAEAEAAEAAAANGAVEETAADEKDKMQTNAGLFWWTSRNPVFWLSCETMFFVFNFEYCERDFFSHTFYPTLNIGDFQACL